MSTFSIWKFSISDSVSCSSNSSSTVLSAILFCSANSFLVNFFGFGTLAGFASAFFATFLAGFALAFFATFLEVLLQEFLISFLVLQFPF